MNNIMILPMTIDIYNLFIMMRRMRMGMGRIYIRSRNNSWSKSRRKTGAGKFLGKGVQIRSCILMFLLFRF